MSAFLVLTRKPTVAGYVGVENASELSRQAVQISSSGDVSDAMLLQAFIHRYPPRFSELPVRTDL